MLEDFNVVLNHLLKFYRQDHKVFVSLERIKKVIKEHAQQSTNKPSMPCLGCVNNECVSCVPCNKETGYGAFIPNTAHIG